MRFFFILILLSSWLLSAGQKQPHSSAVFDNPTYFLDSIRVDFNKYYFDIDDIENVTVKNEYDSVNKTKGKIYITSKKPKDHHFITLADIQRIYTISSVAQAIFMVDDQFLKDDMLSYRIDSTYILKVDIIKGSEISSIKEAFPGLEIIQIKTKSPKNIEDSKKIRLRGK